MKRWMLLALVLPFTCAQAGIKVSGSNFELRQDCVEMSAGGVKISSDDCSSAKESKGNQGNRSVHGNNNPGKGHKKSKKNK